MFIRIKGARRLEKTEPVPYRSPFRYPGGKTWFVPWVRKWLVSLGGRRKIFLEPFAGGGIVSLSVIFEDLAEKAIMVELDDDVGAVWEVILNGDVEWLADEILGFEFSEKNVLNILRSDPASTPERAFQAILRNRVSRSGIMEDGAGLLGDVGCRWYPETLHERIIDIAGLRDRIEFIWGDGIEVYRKWMGRDGVAVYVDPPYPETGDRLYNCSDVDHDEVFSLGAEYGPGVIMTYNNHGIPKGLVEMYGYDALLVPMTTSHHEKKYELLIGNDLSWAEVT